MKFIDKSDMLALLEAQASLNVKYTGDQWMSQIPVSHFLSAMMAEFGELLESSPRTGDTETGWKWWKPYLENDANNNKVEAVDMLHFAMSAVIMNCGIENAMIAYEKLGASEQLDFDYTNARSSTVIMNVSGFCITATINNSVSEVVASLAYLVDSLCIYAEMEPSEMVELYFKKNKLNQARIEGGYTTSADTYEKYDADGVEDNQKLFEQVADCSCEA